MGFLKAFLLLVGFIGFGILALLFGVVALPFLWVAPSLRYRLNEVFIRPFSVFSRAVVGLKLVIDPAQKASIPRPSVMIGNHQTGLDFALISQACPEGVLIVAKRELIRIPLFGWFFWLAGNLLIDRKDRSGSLARLASVRDRLVRHRLNLAIFPEGTRSKSGEFLPFKKGAFQIAAENGLPIVPVVCSSLRGKGIWETFELGGGHVVVSILPAVQTTDWKGKDLAPLIHDIHARMVEEFRRVNQQAGELDARS
jgi:1-acyl-sn-glycerol-3-phosphate acyltransferase